MERRRLGSLAASRTSTPRTCPRALIPALAMTSIVPALIIFSNGVSGTLYEGSQCFHEASQMRGVCKLLPYCSWAVKERRSDIHPQTCSFDGYMPVVCCPYTRTHDPPHLPLRPSRPFRPGDDAGPGIAGPGALQMETSVLPTTPAAMQLEEGVGGPLGPLPVVSAAHSGGKPGSGEPDDLQQEVGALGALGMADRFGVVTATPTATPSATPTATPTATLTATSTATSATTPGIIQLGFGSPAFILG